MILFNHPNDMRKSILQFITNALLTAGETTVWRWQRAAPVSEMSGRGRKGTCVGPVTMVVS